MNGISLDDILLFVDVIRLGSFTKAATKHNITAAAVSKHISFLEKNLNLTLLKRTTRKVFATESGEFFYQYCSKIYTSVNQALTAVTDLHNKPMGLLKISSPTNFSNLVLTPLVTEFTQIYPEIKILIELNDIRKLPEIDNYDVAIRSGKLPDSTLKARKITTIHFLYVVSPIYLKDHPLPNKIADLAHHKTIDYNYREDGLVWAVFKGGKKITVPINPCIISNNAFFIKLSAENGAGIACLPDFMVQKELQNGSLVTCLKSYQTLAQDIWVIHSYGNSYLPKKTRLFIDFLLEKFSVDNISN